MKTFKEMWYVWNHSIDPHKIIDVGLDCYSPYVYIDWSKVQKEYPLIHSDFNNMDSDEKNRFDERLEEWVSFDLQNSTKYRDED